MQACADQRWQPAEKLLCSAMRLFLPSLAVARDAINGPQ
jgi:hypothetical protein